MQRASLALVLLLVGCHAEQPSPVAPTIITVRVPVGPSASPEPPPGPHFALELGAASTVPVHAGEAWHGLVSILPNISIVRPELPLLVSTTCGPALKAHHGFTSGTLPFSCLFAEGTHQVTVLAQMADGRTYQTGMAVVILPEIVVPPPASPAPPSRPEPSPSVDLRALELDKNSTAVRWRFYVVVEHGEFEDADFDFGPGSSCGGSGCNHLDDVEDYIDVEYTIAGTKEVRVAVTVDGDTIRARRLITVTFAP